MNVNPLFDPVFQSKHVAAVIAAGGVPHETASARVANYLRASQLRFRAKDGEGVTATRLMSLADMAVASLLSKLQDLGVADREILDLSAKALYEDRHGVEAILLALRDTWKADPWTLQIDVARDLATGDRRVDVLFGPLDEPRPGEPPEGFTPPASILILTQFLRPLHRILTAPRQGAH